MRPAHLYENEAQKSSAGDAVAILINKILNSTEVQNWGDCCKRFKACYLLGAAPKNRSLAIALLSVGIGHPGDTKHYFKIYG